MLSKYIDVGEVLRPQGIEGLVKDMEVYFLD